MFGTKKQGKERLRTQINTLVGEGTTITGVVQFEGGLHVVGTIKGGAKSEDSNSVLIVSEDALVTGDIYVNHLIVNGQVDGNIYATGKVELFDKARVNGDVHYNVIELPAGAEVNGKLIRTDADNGVEE